MTLRQPPAPVISTLSAPASVSNGIEAGLDRVAAFSWEDWFSHATHQQRAEALGLAKKQGLVYPYQLPPISNGTKASENGKATESGLASWISSLFAGKPDLRSVPKREPFVAFDANLDALQIEAVARALATPDLFLLNGPPGTGKSRVLTEILAQATARGWRSLFLANYPESLDVVLEPLAARTDLFVLRYLDADEKSDKLSPCLRRLTSEEQKKAFRECLIAGAKASQDAAESACKTFQRQESVWAELTAALHRLNESSASLLSSRSDLTQVREKVAQEIESADSTSALVNELSAAEKSHADALIEVDTALKAVHEAKAKSIAELDVLISQITAIEPVYRAKTSAKFWTLSYWTNLFNSTVVAEMESLRQKKAASETVRDGCTREIEALQARKAASINQFETHRQSRIAAEVARRTEEIACQIAALESALHAAEAAWDSCLTQLGGSVIERIDDAIAKARQSWDCNHHLREQQCRFAQQWTRFVETAADSLAEKLPGFANLIAATLPRWHGDIKFHEAFSSPLDLLVIEDADRLTEAEVLKLTRHAKKVVMVGATRPDAAAPISEPKTRSLNGLKPLVSSAWNRLWQTLNSTGSRSTCSWKRIDGRLTCQLQPLSAEDMRYLETELLVDSPDIELRILHRPRSRPSLAYMLFAPRCEFVEAFLFMTREVQEFSLEPLSRTAWWSEGEQSLCRWFGLPTHRVHEWVELERGLRLAFAPAVEGDLPRVLAIEFERSAGWDRTLADAWLHTHRAGGDSERTVYLQTPYRFTPNLCGRLRDLDAGDWLLDAVAGPSAESAGLEFMSVPALNGTDWPSQGAGLEQDLTSPRHSDKLPSMLRTGLPNRGFANLYEAQAVIRRLETMIREETPNTPRPQMAVVALYEGQVELIRKLMEQSPVIKGRSRAVELTTPGRLRQRECDVLIVSLTRSHAHRAVPFGDDVDDLELVLTRARSRIIIIGDPGTLIKRTQTNGAIDRRDASSSAREQALLEKLVKIARA